MRTGLDVVAAVLMVAGCLTALVAAIGLNTVPDAYARLHVQTKATTLAIALTAVGGMLRMQSWADVMKLALLVAFQFWTTPIGSHLLGRAARLSGLAPASPNVVDDQSDAGPDRAA